MTPSLLIRVLRRCEQEFGGNKEHIFMGCDEPGCVVVSQLIAKKRKRLADKIEKRLLYMFEVRNEASYRLGQLDVLGRNNDWMEDE